MNLGTINISNKADSAVIDIDGVIGVPEWWQFDNPEDKISTYDAFKEKVNEIKALKGQVKEIEVNVRSLGGSVLHALLIHDTLKGLDAVVTTNAYGFVASAATTIHQAANKGNRRMSENGLYLIHRASDEVRGTVHQMKQAIKNLETVEKVISNIYAENATNSEYTADFYLSVMDRAEGEGEWLTADEAMQLELIDIKAKPETMTNMVDLKEYNLPKIPDKFTNNKTMKLKEGWSAILNFLKKEKDHEITENELESLNSELTNKATEVSTLTAQVGEKDTKITELTNTVSEKDTTIGEKDAKITDLTNQLATVTSERDQLKANKTETKNVEDPNHGETVLTGNAAAYEKDMENFKD